MNYKPRNFELPRNDTLPRTGDIPPYVFSKNIAIAVDVALATDRPLLVAGKPGCGKSRLAEAMAVLLGWHYLGKTMTSRSRLEELTVEVDHLRRLHDAQTSRDSAEMQPDWAYHNPGIFWWAFDPASAARRGAPNRENVDKKLRLDFPGTRRPQAEEKNHVVLLIDEIDKAQPDLPNDLLEPLDQRSFGLPTGDKITAKDGQRILTIITTNGERELPQAFLRRCVSLLIDEPTEEGLVNIATEHYPDASRENVKSIAHMMIKFRDKAANQGIRPPGTSEFLDAVKACERLGVMVGKDVWPHLEKAVLRKNIDA